MKRKPSFRAAVDPLVDIGRQFLLIENEMRILRSGSDTYEARCAAQRAQSAASRMARDFKKIAYVLECVDDAEYEAEARHAAQ